MQCEQNTLNKLCNGITDINEAIKALDAVHVKAESMADGQEQANCYAHEVAPAMADLRAAVDAWRRSWLQITGRSRRMMTSCSTCRNSVILLRAVPIV